MGLGRWLHTRELKKDLRVIVGLDLEAKAEVKESVSHVIGLIHTRLHVPLHEILESTNYHVIENEGWGKAPLIINKNLRIPLLHQIKAGDESAASMYLAVSVILHSVRAIMDYEFNRNTKLLFWCQRLWHEIYPDEPDYIPRRFRSRA